MPRLNNDIPLWKPYLASVRSSAAFGPAARTILAYGGDKPSATRQNLRGRVSRGLLTQDEAESINEMVDRLDAARRAGINTHAHSTTDAKDWHPIMGGHVRVTHREHTR